MIGTLLTILCPVLGLPVGLNGIYKYRGKRLRYVFCLALFFASVAYCALPVGENDLTRYWSYVQFVSRYSSLSKVFTRSGYAEAGAYGFTTYAWIIGRIGDKNLLQYFSTFSVYFIAIYITCKIAIDTNIGRPTLISYIFLMIISMNLYGIICNVRNVFGFSMISLAVFRDVYQKKRNIFTLILYIVPLFMHNSVILLLVMRIFLIKPFSKSKFIPFLFLALGPLSIAMYNLLYNRIGTSNVIFVIIRNALRKAYTFFTASTDSASRTWAMRQFFSPVSWVHRIAYLSIAVIILLILFLIVRPQLTKLRRNGNESIYLSDNMSKMMLYVEYLCMLTLSFGTMIAPEYWRMVTEVISFGSIIVFSGQALLLETADDGQSFVHMNNYRMLVLAYCIVSGVCLVMWFRNFRIFDLSYMVSQLPYTSPLIIVARLL